MLSLNMSSFMFNSKSHLNLVLQESVKSLRNWGRNLVPKEHDVMVGRCCEPGACCTVFKGGGGTWLICPCPLLRHCMWKMLSDGTGTWAKKGKLDGMVMLYFL